MKKIRDLLRRLPDTPGIYQFLDSAGKVLYIGKAKSLKKRVKSYFQRGERAPKTERLLALTRDLKWLETNSEVEALTLEANLVRQLQPKFNALLRDDKHFLYFKITREDFPRLLAVRKVEPDGARYFGPKTDSRAVRRGIQLIQKLFRLRVCPLGIEEKDGKVVVMKKTVKYPCLYAHLNLCSAPCLTKISRATYAQQVAEAVDFLAGDTAKITAKLREKMAAAAATKNFELATQLRDKIFAVEGVNAQQLASMPDLASRDVAGVKIEFSKAYFALLLVRHGKLVDAKNFVFKVGESELEEILESFLTQYFSISADFPDEILLPQKIANAELLESWLQTKAGKRVKLLFPQKGEKAQLLGLAEKNAAAFAVQNKAKFENASEKTIGAANELARGLKIDRELKRIEAYDISHFSGDATAGALVVFERGEPKNSDYRHFKIRSLEKGAVDDCASLAEILSRRMEYLVPQNSAIKIRKASKKQLLEIEKILHTKIDPQKEEWFAAFCESRVAGGFRLVSHGPKRFEATALFGEDLTEILLKFALRKNAGKLYFCGDSEIAARLGFREIKKIPEFLRGQKRVFVAEKSARADTSFAARPDLVLLDGGKGQLSAVLKNVKFPKGVAVVALAKKTEELFKMTNGKFERILLPRDSQALYLVQRVRDEAHRFANSLREKLQNPTKK